ncbi:hypothetical protein B296_00055502, partial [Ensete ventricosum]
AAILSNFLSLSLSIIADYYSDMALRSNWMYQNNGGYVPSHLPFLLFFGTVNMRGDKVEILVINASGIRQELMELRKD